MSKSRTKKRHHRNQSHVGRNVALAILAILLVVAGISAYLLTHYVGLLGDLREEEQGTAISDEVRAEDEKNAVVASSDINADVFTILLIGVDSRKDTYTGRSDSQILLSINQKSKKLVICSVLRDCYVSIPDHGYNRINAAYSYGGTTLLTRTIKNNFGIDVDRVAVVNFKVVADFIDAVGGVDINVSSEEIERINGSLGEQNRIFGNPTGTDMMSTSQAGDVHLNGNQALAYARIRKIGTDFERTKRQRVVLEDAMDKVGDMSLSQQSALMKEFLPRVHTDLTMSEVINMGSLALRMKSYSVSSFSMPVDGSWSDMRVNGMDVLDVNYAANRTAWENAVK